MQEEPASAELSPYRRDSSCVSWNLLRAGIKSTNAFRSVRYRSESIGIALGTRFRSESTFRKTNQGA